MKRSIWIAGGVVVLVLLVAGAAFVGGRLLSRQPPQQNMEVVQTGGEEGGEGMTGQTVFSGDEIEIERPEERPDESPTIVGVVTARNDNSLTVGTGLTGVAVGRPDGSIEMKYNGPEVEVVVTHDTEIYKSKIDVDIRQDTWEPGSLDDIAQGAVVTVWGEKRGDRTVARVLAYDPMRIELP